MKVSEFDFDLPQELIADASGRAARRRAAAGRSARALADRRVADLPDLLRPGDLLVFNDTRVIPARLTGRRGAARRRGHPAPAISAAARWRAFAKGGAPAAARRPRSCSPRISPPRSSRKEPRATRSLSLRSRGRRADARPWRAAARCRCRPTSRARTAPTRATAPTTRPSSPRQDGAVAAPTAGLHFTPALLAALRARGDRLATVTLHVGAGTFLPVKADGHRATTACMPNAAMLDADGRRARSTPRAPRGGRIVAVGTTSLRTARKRRRRRTARVAPFAGETAIFITPGYRFRAVDLLLTNFHLPRSTLFMLVAAFAGLERMQARLCPRHRPALSLLFLWRCLPAASARDDA